MYDNGIMVIFLKFVSFVENRGEWGRAGHGVMVLRAKLWYTEIYYAIRSILGTDQKSP